MSSFNETHACYSSKLVVARHRHQPGFTLARHTIYLPHLASLFGRCLCFVARRDRSNVWQNKGTHYIYMTHYIYIYIYIYIYVVLGVTRMFLVIILEGSGFKVKLSNILRHRTDNMRRPLGRLYMQRTQPAAVHQRCSPS